MVDISGFPQPNPDYPGEEENMTVVMKVYKLCTARLKKQILQQYKCKLKIY